MTGQKTSLQVSNLFKHYEVSILFAPAKLYGQKSCEFNDKVILFDFALFFNYINTLICRNTSFWKITRLA